MRRHARVVQAMRDSVVGDEAIVAQLFGPAAGLDRRLRERLDYAEKSLPRSKRDGPSRTAEFHARRRVGAAAAQVTGDPWQDLRVLRAFVEWLEAVGAVYLAEPNSHRDWLPPYIQADPQGQLGREIARVKSEMAAIECSETERAERELGLSDKPKIATPDMWGRWREDQPIEDQLSGAKPARAVTAGCCDCVIPFPDDDGGDSCLLCGGALA